MEQTNKKNLKKDKVILNFVFQRKIQFRSEDDREDILNETILFCK